jgi:hypothetical protein
MADRTRYYKEAVEFIQASGKRGPVSTCVLGNVNIDVDMKKVDMTKLDLDRSLPTLSYQYDILWLGPEVQMFFETPLMLTTLLEFTNDYLLPGGLLLGITPDGGELLSLFTRSNEIKIGHSFYTKSIDLDRNMPYGSAYVVSDGKHKKGDKRYLFDYSELVGMGKEYGLVGLGQKKVKKEDVNTFYVLYKPVNK